MRRIFFISLLLLSSCSDKYVSMVRTSPFSPDWKFTESGKNSWLPAKVPGLVQTDLVQNEVIENPLFENNEIKLQWISDKNWEYKADFDVSDSLMKFKSIDFVFEGLDTYADVFLNDSLLFSADNMFREWRANGKKFLKPGSNSMKVVLYSPGVLGEKKRNETAYTLPSGEPVQPGISPFIRKAPYQFGWDWSPRFLTMGIWKPVKIVAHDNVFITGIHIRTVEIADTCAWLSADVTVSSDVDLPNAVITVLDAFKAFKIRKGLNTAEVKFRIFQPELWWPNGYGKQHLYNLTAKLFVNDYFVDSVVARTGIRTVELFQDEDEWGRSFYFRVNGLPVFMKGANYVPQSNFLTDVTDENYRTIIDDAASVGMNMLRVWGGGIYENDLFYDLCDEKGILVWQDFMFAGCMYPGDSLFLNNVAREAEYQVKRLRNHPSVAIWCGNNEMEVAWTNWGWQKQFKINPVDSAKIYSGYKNLFEQVIPGILTKYDPNRPYIPSSPLSNWGKRENFNSGNMHYWGVWHGEESIDSFRVNVPRFMTEYGMQSYPSYQALAKNTDDARITISGDFMKNRQKSYKGNGLLNRYIQDNFARPGNVEELCFLSQLNQAEAMKIAIESHRKAARFCMGTLYWQFNDVWDGASWSTLEHGGRWKAAHYALKRLYAQSLLIAQTESDTTKIFLQTENTSGQTGTLRVLVTDFKGRIIADYSREVSAGYLVAEPVFEIPLNVLLPRQDKAAFYLSAELRNGQQLIASAIHYFVKPSSLKLLKPELKSEVNLNNDGAEILVSADVLVKGLFIECTSAEGHFSDNYFDLLPGSSKLITFKPSSGTIKEAGDFKFHWFLPGAQP